MTAPASAGRRHDDLDAVIATLLPEQDLLLVLDFDGTLSPIVDVPDDAAPMPGAIEAIRTLATRWQVVISSGRGLDDLLRRIPEDLLELGVAFVGGHGTEALLGDGTRTTLVEVAALRRTLHGALDALETALAGADGFRIETKSSSIAVHYRQAEPTEVERLLPSVREILGSFSDDSPGWDVLDGKLVVEMRPANIDKGRALTWLLDQYPGRMPVMLGDDVTDEDGFRVAVTRGGHAVLVAEEPRGTEAGWRVDDPARVVELLRELGAPTEGRPGVAAAARRTTGRYRPLRDYGMIGDSRSAALVSVDGSIDWFCFPRFDSPSVFAAILDEDKGGRWRIRPVDHEQYEIQRTYLGETNVLVTRFARGGNPVVTITDFFVYSRVNAFDVQHAEHTLLRRVEVWDDVDVIVEFQPRFDYARASTEIVASGRGLTASAGSDYVNLVAPDIDFTISEHVDGQPIAVGVLSLKRDDQRWLRLQTPGSERSPHRHLTEDDLLDLTVRTWGRWAELIDYDGPWRDDVVRSALVLKGLVYEPTGALVAAPTASLPEGLGGIRNWDYRYAWIRDSAYVLETFLRIGHTREAETFIRWLTELVERIGGTRALRPMYRVTGDDDLDEYDLEHLEGYEQSSPVRIGNGAADQLQLDIYGAAMQLGYLTERVGSEVPPAQWRVILELVDTVISQWEQPDAGLWEARNDPRHHVFSKFQCWLSVDRAIRIGTDLGLRGPYPKWRRIAAEIRDSILEYGYDDDLGTFTQSYGDPHLDAAVLLLPLRGFLPASDPRIRSTVEALRRDLEVSDGLLLRYRSEDGLTGHEGAFLMCSFWLVEVLARMGDLDEAERIFERLRSLAGPLGLFAEEVDSVTHEHLGNFPQGFTHMGLIGAACAINEERRRRLR